MPGHRPCVGALLIALAPQHPAPAGPAPARLRLRTLLVPLLLALVFLASAAAAQAVLPLGGAATDPAAPVQIEADRLQVSQSDGTASFDGNVVVVQGELRLSADRLLVDYAPPETRPATGADAEAEAGAASPRGRIRRLTASGKVLLATPSEQAEAAEAIYDLETRRITMTGDVLLTQGGSILAGQELVVNLDDGTAAMSGRVRTVLDPGSP